MIDGIEPVDLDGDSADDDLERTTEELADAMAAGSTISAMIGASLVFDVNLSGVAVWTRLPLSARAVADLAAGLEGNAMRLDLPDVRSIADDPRTGQDVDAAEVALLERALKARAGLVGGA